MCGAAAHPMPNAVESYVRVCRNFSGNAEGERATESLRPKEHGWTHSEVGMNAYNRAKPQLGVLVLWCLCFFPIIR